MSCVVSFMKVVSRSQLVSAAAQLESDAILTFPDF